jgi:hypothetical protein
MHLLLLMQAFKTKYATIGVGKLCSDTGSYLVDLLQ